MNALFRSNTRLCDMLHRCRAEVLADCFLASPGISAVDQILLTMRRSWFVPGAVLWGTLAAFPACAADFSWSGFGTVGYAASNVPYSYQRYINNHGTLRRDSLAGLQVDAKLTDRIGATAQVLMAPESDNDRRYMGSFSWAFISWRPTNELLIRAGKQRIPLYLFSQNYDVGATYDFLRLPTEMYSISPGNEFNGLSFSKSWTLGDSDVIVDGYWGNARINGRFWFRDGFPPIQSAGAFFSEIALEGKGLAISYKKNENTYRLGLHRAVGRQSNGLPLPATFPFVAVFPGLGYYQVDSNLPGPGIPTVRTITNTIATIGGDVAIGLGFRVVGEFARTYVNTPNVDIANASDRGYLSLLKTIEKWTPYVTYAFLRSNPAQLDLYNKVNSNTVPSFIPGSGLINASQRAGADGMLTFDQSSMAIGTSYSLTPTSKIKAELMRVRIGQVSSLVDAPPGSNIRNQHINVISLSYSMVF